MKNLTTLYRHFSANDTLLYVGISDNPDARSRQHVSASVWFHQVERTTYERFASREIAAAAERTAIREEVPRYNLSQSNNPNQARSDLRALRAAPPTAPVSVGVFAAPSRTWLRQKDLIPQIVPFSHATLWRKVKAGKFPAPCKLSDRITAWRASDVQEWVRLGGAYC